MTGAYAETISILKELGTEHLISYQDDFKVRFRNIKDHDILDSSVFPGRLGILAGLMKLKNIGFGSKIRISKLFSKLLFNFKLSENITVHDFLQKQGQTKESIEWFWEPLTLATLNSGIHTAPAELLVTVLKKAFFSSPENSRLVFPDHTLESLLRPFPEWLRRFNGQAVFSRKITSVSIKDMKIRAIYSGNEEYKADKYIFAIPPDRLYRILPWNIRQREFFSALDMIRYSPIISIYLWLDIPFPDIDLSAMIGTRSQWVFNRTKICKNTIFDDSKYKGRITITISNAKELMKESSEDLESLCWKEVKQLFPEIQNAHLLHSRTIKIKNATIEQTPSTFGILPEQKTSISNLFLAGDHTKTGLPATIEAAALSGKLAANLIIDEYQQ